MEERTVQGIIKAYAREIKTSGNRNSRGVMIDAEWHNITGEETALKNLDTVFPKGVV
ncbi:unnamed protein product, partial [marine sediment metagenome]